MKNNLKTAGIIALSAVFFIADRAAKWLFINAWPQDDFRLIGDWLRLKLSLNQGIAFGLPVDHRLTIILTGLALFVLIHLAWLNYKKNNFYLLSALALIIAGAYSNLLDRLLLSAVADYIYLRYFTVFNLADIMITCGIAAIVFSCFRRKKSVADDLKQPADSCYNTID